MTSPSHSIRKRRRPALSCTECYRRKVRCDRNKPSCGQCKALDLTLCCAYRDNHRALPASQGPMASADQGYEQEGRQTTAMPSHSNHTPSPSGRIRGTISKTRVFGSGHWMNTFSLTEALTSLQPIGECYESFLRNPDNASRHGLAETVFECKRLAQTIKQSRPSRKCLPADIHKFFPIRPVMDQFVHLYFTTFETCYGILDYSSFVSEYRCGIENPTHVESSLLLQVLLVMTIAGPLHEDPTVREQMAANARIWINIAQTWLSAPLEKDRLTLKGIQVHCLLLLSRQVNQVGADLVWISVGQLLRMAMQMGLHQDPDLLGEMGEQNSQMRRRLWYTILEINAQAALDSGMPPMISSDDYTTKPPAANCDSAGVAEDLEGSTSFQPLLATSLPLRLSAIRSINSMLEETSYEKILEIERQLAVVCQDAAVEFDKQPAMFGSSFCCHLLRRFSLCLHYRSAVKSKINPLFSHSRQVALEAALDLVSLLDDNQYHRVLCAGGGMFRDLITRGALLLFLELNPRRETDTSMFGKKRTRARQEPLLQDARRVVEYAKDRMLHGDTNVKTYVCLSMMLAQAEANLDNNPVAEAVSKAMHESLRACHGILEASAANLASSSVMDSELDFWTSGTVSPGFDGTLDSDFDELFDFNFSDPQFAMQWPDQTFA
ncbi:hypothetical protein BJX70DRAFT_136923 [Aspergillus crustosus]